jgi:putative tryptophan/tyrosine transport system substrate-binding protein
MNRRDFITLLGGAAATPILWPLAARAQQPALPVIGFLHPGLPEATAGQLAGFRKGLSEAGYIEGRNVAIEYRWASNKFDRLPELADDLVRHRVAVIAVVGSGAAARAAKAATTTIPVVFGTAADPVRDGLVASLNRPGGNVTGVSYMNNELMGKRLGFLHELTPGAKRFAMLVHPLGLGVDTVTQDVQSAATAIGAHVEILQATNSREIDNAFATLARMSLEGLMVTPNPLFASRRVQLVTLATRHAVPVIYNSRDFTEIGGLMSYGGSGVDQARQVGIYVGRVLKGEKPAELPIMRASKFEMIINLQTARTLGLEMPPTLLAIADEVIE